MAKKAGVKKAAAAKKSATIKRAAAKKAKPAPKKAVAKKIVKKVAKKVAPKKIAKKVPAKKAVAKKVVAKKVSGKKAIAKKVSGKKIVNKAAPKKITRKTVAKAAVKKAVAKKIAPKSVAKKPAVKKISARVVISAPKGPRYEGPVWPLMDVILDAMEDAKAEQIIPINVEGRSSMADGMVIASGRANRHVAAIADQLVEKLKAFGQKDVRVEGLETSDWVLVDAGNVIVHIFRPEVRSFYNLEKLWSEHAPLENRDSE